MKKFGMILGLVFFLWVGIARVNADERRLVIDERVQPTYQVKEDGTFTIKLGILAVGEDLVYTKPLLLTVRVTRGWDRFSKVYFEPVNPLKSGTFRHDWTEPIDFKVKTNIKFQEFNEKYGSTPMLIFVLKSKSKEFSFISTREDERRIPLKSFATECGEPVKISRSKLYRKELFHIPFAIPAVRKIPGSIRKRVSILKERGASEEQLPESESLVDEEARSGDPRLPIDVEIQKNTQTGRKLRTSDIKYIPGPFVQKEEMDSPLLDSEDLAQEEVQSRDLEIPEVVEDEQEMVPAEQEGEVESLDVQELGVELNFSEIPEEEDECKIEPQTREIRPALLNVLRGGFLPPEGPEEGGGSGFHPKTLAQTSGESTFQQQLLSGEVSAGEQSKNGLLPETGEKNSFVMVVLGVLLMCSVVVVGKKFTYLEKIF